MAGGEPRILDVVEILDSDSARGLELVGAEGVVLGVTKDETTDERWYAVQVGDLPTVMLATTDLRLTGRSVPRESVYPGDRLRVSREGEVLSGEGSTPLPADRDETKGP